MKHFDLVEATFQPQNLETLKERAVQWIGWRGTWEASWIIEEGPYEGTFAMCVMNSRPPFLWVPEIDLTEIVLIYTLDGAAID